MTTKLERRPSGASGGRALIRALRPSHASREIELLADYLGDEQRPRRDPPARSCISATLRCGRTPDVEDAVCRALMALGVMCTSCDHVFRLRPRPALADDVVAAIREFSGTIPWQYLRPPVGVVMTSRQALAFGEVDALRRPDVPSIGPRGMLTYRNRSVCLSERNTMLVSVFVYHFDEELTDLELLDRVWPEGRTTRWTVRMCLRQLDRRSPRVGLTIVEVGEHHAARNPHAPRRLSST